MAGPNDIGGGWFWLSLYYIFRGYDKVKHWLAKIWNKICIDFSR